MLTFRGDLVDTDELQKGDLLHVYGEDPRGATAEFGQQIADAVIEGLCRDISKFQQEIFQPAVEKLRGAQ